jgi:hypothetical protein
MFQVLKQGLGMLKTYEKVSRWLEFVTWTDLQFAENVHADPKVDLQKHIHT